MKNFSDNFIGALVVGIALLFGGACLRYIVTGSIANTVETVQPIIIPDVNITNQGDQTCYQIFAGQCKQ